MAFFDRIFRRRAGDKDVQPDAQPDRASAFQNRFSKLKQELASKIFAGNDPAEMAYLTGAGLLVEQLARAEAITRAKAGGDDFLSSRLGHPWVAGYVFGVSAFMLDNFGLSRASEPANELIQRLHSEVYGPTDLAEAERLSQVAMESPGCEAGMYRGGRDAEAYLAAGANDQASSLTQFLVGAEGNDDEGLVARELGRQLFEYGRTSDKSLVAGAKAYYERAMGVLSEKVRGEMLMWFCEQVEARKVSGNALMPFLFVDTSPFIISSAALHAAEFWPLTNGDVLSGPRELAGYAQELAGPGSDEPRSVAILTGLLLLGDRRVTELLGSCWRWLSIEGRRELSHLRGVAEYAPVLDWLVDWLEDCEGDEFGAVAAALTRASQSSKASGVLEVQRTFPAWDAEDGQVLKLVGQWTFREFGERLRPKLEQIAENESEPKIMHHVLEAWELGLYGPPPALRGIPALVEADKGPRRLVSLVEPVALQRSTRFRPVPLSESEVLEHGGDLLLCWGIFNPYGPTFGCLARLRTEHPDTDLLLYRMLNPFRQDTVAVSSLVGTDRTDGQALAACVGRLFQDNLVGMLYDQPLYLNTQSAPNFVLFPFGDDAYFASVQTALLRSPGVVGADLVTEIDYMRRYPCRPWERASEQREKAFRRFAQGGETIGSVPYDPPNREAIDEWWSLIHDGMNTLAELGAFPSAWTGAIENVSDPELTTNAYTLQHLETFLARFGYPVLQMARTRLEKWRDEG